MPVRLACHWCSTFNDCPGTGPITCVKCAHRADVARESCDCLLCQVTRGELFPGEALKVLRDQSDLGNLPELEMPDGIPPVPTGFPELNAVRIVCGTMLPDSAVVNAYRDAVTIRVQDLIDKNSWVEITVPSEVITEWLKATMRADDAYDDGGEIE
jgi:hypothetical protein